MSAAQDITVEQLRLGKVELYELNEGDSFLFSDAMNLIPSKQPS